MNLCRFYLQGTCRYGSICRNRHGSYCEELALKDRNDILTFTDSNKSEYVNICGKFNAPNVASSSDNLSSFFKFNIPSPTQTNFFYSSDSDSLIYPEIESDISCTLTFKYCDNCQKYVICRGGLSDCCCAMKPNEATCNQNNRKLKRKRKKRRTEATVNLSLNPSQESNTPEGVKVYRKIENATRIEGQECLIVINRVNKKKKKIKKGLTRLKSVKSETNHANSIKNTIETFQHSVTHKGKIFSVLQFKVKILMMFIDFICVMYEISMTFLFFCVPKSIRYLT